MPFLHIPFPEQSSGQAFRAQSSPIQPWSHLHVLFSQQLLVKIKKKARKTFHENRIEHLGEKNESGKKWQRRGGGKLRTRDLNKHLDIQLAASNRFLSIRRYSHKFRLHTTHAHCNLEHKCALSSHHPCSHPHKSKCHFCNIHFHCMNWGMFAENNQNLYNCKNKMCENPRKK